jgi:hypothetical protein
MTKSITVLFCTVQVHFILCTHAWYFNQAMVLQIGAIEIHLPVRRDILGSIFRITPIVPGKRLYW